MQIVDSPRFKWRGVLLDVGRHFFEVPFIFKLLDVMAFHKMNRFHWHLTEDQVKNSFNAQHSLERWNWLVDQSTCRAALASHVMRAMFLLSLAGMMTRQHCQVQLPAAPLQVSKIICLLIQLAGLAAQA